MRDGTGALRANSSALEGTAVARAATTTGSKHHESRMRHKSLAGLKRIHHTSKNFKSKSKHQTLQNLFVSSREIEVACIGVLGAGGTLPTRR